MAVERDNVGLLYYPVEKGLLLSQEEACIHKQLHRCEPYILCNDELAALRTYVRTYSSRRSRIAFEATKTT